MIQPKSTEIRIVQPTTNADCGHSDGQSASPHTETAEHGSELEIDIVNNVRVRCLKLGRAQEVIENAILPLETFSGSDTVCTMTTIFNGNGGDKCSTYSSRNLGQCILSEFRNIVHRVSEEDQQPSDVQLYQPGSAVDLKKAASHGGAEYAALIHAVKKGLDQIHRNFVDIAVREKDESTCEVMSVILFGPDAGGQMKLVTCNVGTCKGMLVREGKAIPLCLHPNSGGAIGKLNKADGIKRARKGGVDSWVESRSMDLEKDELVLIGTDAFWAGQDMQNVIERLKAGMNAEFQAFVDDAVEEQKDETWFFDTSKNWLMTNDFKETLQGLVPKKSVDVMACLIVFDWHPLEVFVGGS